MFFRLVLFGEDFELQCPREEAEETELRQLTTKGNVRKEWLRPLASVFNQELSIGEWRRRGARCRRSDASTLAYFRVEEVESVFRVSGLVLSLAPR